MAWRYQCATHEKIKDLVWLFSNKEKDILVSAWDTITDVFLLLVAVVSHTQQCRVLYIGQLIDITRSQRGSPIVVFIGWMTSPPCLRDLVTRSPRQVFNNLQRRSVAFLSLGFLRGWVGGGGANGNNEEIWWVHYFLHIWEIRWKNF